VIVFCPRCGADVGQARPHNAGCDALDVPPGGWLLPNPDIGFSDGAVLRRYRLIAYQHATRVRACAQLAVLFWLAPRGRWGRVDVEFGP
jgi:hypothetical protein